MEKKVNQNIIWSEMFFRQLSKQGVKNVIICPGSRSTPLVFGITANKKLKTFNLVDERSAAFFALGIAKATNEPVAIITTSGTAVAELYPAIIEAYQQRIPLIICTADRPPELQNCGSNQTINQKNIFANHIRYYFESDLPTVKYDKIKKLITLTKKALFIATTKDRGPVHINLPFRQPFEPNNFTDSISDEAYKNIFSLDVTPKINPSSYSLSKKFIREIENSEQGLIIYNEKNVSKKVFSTIKKLSSALKLPIIDDATSGLRFTSKTNKLVCHNSSTILRSANLLQKIKPDLIIQFGDAPVSNSLLKFYNETKCSKILVNEFGDVKDPSKTFSKILSMKTLDFCNAILQNIKPKKHFSDKTKMLMKADETTNSLKREFLKSMDLSFEGKIVNEILTLIPESANVMFSNSMPVRDFDTFSPVIEKNINIYTNRGASGIDGINSTALGIAASSKQATVLFTGDLSFYHDLNGLFASYKYSIPLTVILINNNGGGIFEMLPVSKFGKIFQKNFITATNLDFKPFVEGFGGKHVIVKSSGDLKKQLTNAFESPAMNVLEIKTDSHQSTQIRKKYYSVVLKEIEKTINVN